MSTQTQLIDACKRHKGTFQALSQSETTIRALRGVGTSGVAQSKAETFTNSKTGEAGKAYVGGMCTTMALFWMAHENGSREKSFIEWIKPEGNFHTPAVNVLVVQTVAYKNTHFDSSGKPQKYDPTTGSSEFEARFLLRYGLVTSGEIEVGTVAMKTALGAAKERFYMVDLFGGGGPGGGHSCAARTSNGKDAAFFDPNYGDFNFSSGDACAAFFEDFQTITDYDTKYRDQKFKGFKRAA